MPVSHIGLTVSHLPTSCSFFLEALKPLGYKYIGQQGNQIGFGVHDDDADFFICQESHGNKAGAAHIAFSAPYPAAVDDFHARALRAGGKDHGRPAVRDEKSGYYSAAVRDFDGNSIEVVCRKKLAIGNGHADDTRSQHSNSNSRVLSWQKDVVARRSGGSVVSSRDDRSVVSSSPITAAPAIGTTTTTATNTGTSTGLIGALFGVAAGAAAAAAYLENAKASESTSTTTVPRTNTLAIESMPASPRTVIDLGPTSYYAPPSTVNIRPAEGSIASRAPSTKTRAIEAPPTRRNSSDNYIWQQRAEARSSASKVSHNPYGQHSARVSEAPESIVSSFHPGSSAKSTYSRHAKASTVISGRDVPLPGSSVASRSSTSLDRPVAPSDSISQVSSSRSSQRHHHNSGRHSSGGSRAKSYRPGSEASSSASSQRTARPTTPTGNRSTISAARTLPVRSLSASRATPTKGRSVVSYSEHGSGARILGFRLGGEKSTTGGSMVDGSPAGFQLWEDRRRDG